MKTRDDIRAVYFDLLREFLKSEQKMRYYKKQTEIYRSLYFGELNNYLDKGLKNEKI